MVQPAVGAPGDAGIGVVSCVGVACPDRAASEHAATANNTQKRHMRRGLALIVPPFGSGPDFGDFASNCRMAQEHSKLCKDSHITWESRSSGTSLQLAKIRLP